LAQDVHTYLQPRTQTCTLAHISAATDTNLHTCTHLQPRTQTCIHICSHGPRLAHLHTYLQPRTQTCTHICSHRHKLAHLHTSAATDTNLHTYLQPQTQTCTHICSHRHKLAHLHTYLQPRTQTFTLAHIYAATDTNLHTCTHICSHRHKLSPSSVLPVGCTVDKSCHFDVRRFNGTCKLTAIICRCYKQEFVCLFALASAMTSFSFVHNDYPCNALFTRFGAGCMALANCSVGCQFIQPTNRTVFLLRYLYYNIALSIRSCVNPQGIVSMELISSNVAYY